MANERLWLLHPASNLRLMIGKRLGTEYYIDDGIAERLNGYYQHVFKEAPWESEGERDHFELRHDGDRPV